MNTLPPAHLYYPLPTNPTPNLALSRLVSSDHDGDIDTKPPSSPHAYHSTNSLSDSDRDGKWQMTSSPGSGTPTQPQRQQPQRSPPRSWIAGGPPPLTHYHRPNTDTERTPAPSPQVQIQTPVPAQQRVAAAPSDPFPISSMNQSHIFPAQSSSYLVGGSRTSLVKDGYSGGLRG
jgi:hypothetical protein